MLYLKFQLDQKYFSQNDYKEIPNHNDLTKRNWFQYASLNVIEVIQVDFYMLSYFHTYYAIYKIKCFFFRNATKTETSYNKMEL